MNSYPADWYHRLPHPVKEIFTVLESHEHICYIVGGAVRDFLLGKEPKDFDLVTNAKPEEIARYFPKTIDVGRAFGIMVVVIEGTNVELASFRKDGDYQDNRRPETIEFASPEVDALRRDFTMNGLFWDPKSAEIIDFVGGVEDIRQRRIRAIGDAHKRFQEDALRILRALRFFSQLPDFTLDEKIPVAIAREKERLRNISRERITAEMNLILLSSKPSRALHEMEVLGILSLLFPEIPLQNWDALDAFQEKSLALSWSQLFLGLDAKKLHSVLARLVLSKEDRAAIEQMPDLLSTLEKYGSLEIFEKKELLSKPAIAIALTLHPSTQVESDLAKWKPILQEAPLVTGSDLLRLGMKPGKEMGQILDEIRRQQRNETLKTKEEALEFAKSSLTS